MKLYSSFPKGLIFKIYNQYWSIKTYFNYFSFFFRGRFHAKRWIERSVWDGRRRSKSRNCKLRCCQTRGQTKWPSEQPMNCLCFAILNVIQSLKKQRVGSNPERTDDGRSNWIRLARFQNQLNYNRRQPSCKDNTLVVEISYLRHSEP